MSSNNPPSSFKLENLVDLYTKSVEKYKDEKHIDVEFELRFGTKPGQINKTMFDDTFKKLIHYGFKVHTSAYMMRITMEYDNARGGKSDSNIRIEMNDLESIQSVCETSLLPDMRKLNFTQKMYVPELKGPIYNNDYGYRSSVQTEKSISRGSNIVKSITSEWGSQKKLFRYIYRTTLKHPDFPNIQIDMSSTRSNLNNRQIKFKDANIFNEDFVYEIELEVNGYKKGMDIEKLTQNIKKCVKYCLCGIQNTYSVPIKLKERKDVLKNYFDIMEKFNYDNDEVKRVPKTSNFMGPSSYTLQRENIVNDDMITSINIRDGFCVTDKADGERKLLLITKTGHMYFIDTNIKVQYTGSRTTNKKLFNTIIDGEHILYNKYKTYINLFAAFDVYIIGPKDYRTNKFYLTEKEKEDMKYEEITRYDALSVIVQKLNSESTKYDIPKQPLKVSVKSFAFEDKDNNVSIFKCCWTILNKINTNNYEYNTDGLIFTSKYLGVTQEKEGDKIKNFKYSWKHSFKWKPPQYNTIDFLVEVQKDSLGKPLKRTKMVNDEPKSYYEVHLKVGFNEKNKMHGFLDAQKQIMNLEYENNNSKDSKVMTYRPENFKPTNPSDENAYICHIPLTKKNNEDIMITEEEDIMEDDMIVEFRYEKNIDDMFMSWVPLRVRFDKTSGYRTSKSNYGNAYHVANSNWQSIHNPITEKMISDEKYLSTKLLENMDDDVYYNNENKQDSQTYPLRNFHNLYVKEQIIKIVSSKFKTPKLLDLAVGKGGDMDKWIRANIHMVVGIDLSKDNIHNNINGVCSRYLKAYHKMEKVPIGVFIEGDSSKLISTGDFAESVVDIQQEITLEELEVKPKEKLSVSVMKSLSGVGTKENETIPFLKKYHGLCSDKFDIVSIQFALHYMFKNEETLHNFLRNVCEYTKVGGYLIGTCYSGEKVYETLKDVKQGERIEKYKNNKKIWHVVKGYNNDDNEFLENDERSLGYSITVFQESINKEFEEYLVNFTYFVKMMEQYGFVLEKSHKFKGKNIDSMAGFEDMFKLFEKEKNKDLYKSAKNISEEEKFVSFLNNYFIFRKQNDANAKLVYDYYVNKMHTDDVKTDLKISRAIRTNKIIELE